MSYVTPHFVLWDPGLLFPVKTMRVLSCVPLVGVVLCKKPPFQSKIPKRSERSTVTKDEKYWG